MYKTIITDQISNNIEESLDIISKLGFNYVDIHNVYGKSIEELSDHELTKLKLLLSKYNLKVKNIASTVFFLCPLYSRYEVSSFNDNFYTIKGDIETHKKFLKRTVKIALELEAESIRIFPFRFPDNENREFGTDYDINKIISILKEVISYLDETNLFIVIENCPYTHLPKAEMTYKVVKTINNSKLRMLWDPANSYRAFSKNVNEKYLNLSVYEEFRLFENYIGHVHLKNYQYCKGLKKPYKHVGLYDGDLDMKRIILGLKSTNISCAFEPEVSFDVAIDSCKKYILK